MNRIPKYVNPIPISNLKNASGFPIGAKIYPNWAEILGVFEPNLNSWKSFNAVKINSRPPLNSHFPDNGMPISNEIPNIISNFLIT